MKTVSERFWEKVDKSGDCWIWRGGQRHTGYGRFRTGHSSNSPKVAAHRFAFQEAYGPITDPQICICHKCDVKLCVRPDHLFLGTRQDNNADRDAKGRTARGQQVGNARLTPESVAEIRSLYVVGSRTLGSNGLARRYGVSQMTVLRAVWGESWRPPE